MSAMLPTLGMISIASPLRTQFPMADLQMLSVSPHQFV